MQEESDSQSYPDIPGYKILSELGRGGIATVYLAVQESLGRKVALKVMSPLLAMEPDYAERFIREGRTVAQLNHSNITTVYDIGLEKHQLFIAMEYIPGGNMRAVMAEHQDDPEWALSIIGQIALALGYAHTVGIVHRDVKPENILFRENGSAVLTDFGIAKTITSNTNLTRAGSIIGTPKYMSPEQTDGLGNDPRTDIYSLGIILFELLTGEVPYDSDNTMAVLYAHVHSPVPDLPDDLSDLQPLLNSLLAKKAKERAEDCDELAEIIRITRRERHYALKDPEAMKARMLARETQQAANADKQFPEQPSEKTKKPEKTDNEQKNTASQRLKPLSLNHLNEKFIILIDKLDEKNRYLKYIVAALITVILIAFIKSIFSNDVPQAHSEARTDPAVETTINADTEKKTGRLEEHDSSLFAVDEKQNKNPERQAAVSENENLNQKITAAIDATEATTVDNKPDTAESSAEASPESPSLNNKGQQNNNATTDSSEERTQLLVTRFLADESHDELVRQQLAVTDAASNDKKEAEKQTIARARLQTRINRLLTNARNAVQESRISAPANNNAIDYYKQVLKLSPHNRRALRGLNVSGDLIHEKAKVKHSAGDKYLALQLLDQALKLIPDHRKLLTLKQTIEASFNPNSSYASAERYYHGVNGIQNRTRAVYYYRKAAELGHIQAMNNLAVAYADGDGVKRNDRLAMNWLKKSAELDNSEAMYNLALGYHFSSLKNPPKAFDWVKKSAEKEYRPAYMLIGWMTTTGTGVRINTVKAIKWDLKGMFNPISSSQKTKYRIPRNWQNRFMIKYKASTNTE